MPWVRVVLSQYDVDSGVVEQIQGAFSIIVAQNAVHWRELGLFRRGNMLYFSPKAAEVSGELLSKFRHADCSPPSLDRVETVVVGDLKAIPFSAK